MRGFVAPTDHGWYRFLRARPDLDEVNFWRPGGGRLAALNPGEPFFFKLKAPHNAIGGFGIFAGFSSLPVWRAWDVFGQANGTTDQWALLERLQRLGRRVDFAQSVDRVIGCIAITQPVFFAPDDWVPTPTDWASTIVSGRAYDLTVGPGRQLWEACLAVAAAQRDAAPWTVDALQAQRSGAPRLIVPRLGQASFRLGVLDAYGHQCAVTTEHSLPVLDAAHIRPWSAGGAHALPNGLPLRSDLHRLFDLGYVTVRPDLRFAVSRSLRDEFANGRAYYDLDGRAIQLPADVTARPDAELLAWHEAEVFRG